MLCRYFWWPGFNKDVWEYVLACPACNLNKSLHQPASGLLRLLSIPARPWSNIALEFIIGVPTSHFTSVILTVFLRPAISSPLPGYLPLGFCLFQSCSAARRHPLKGGYCQGVCVCMCSLRSYLSPQRVRLVAIYQLITDSAIKEQQLNGERLPGADARSFASLVC